MTAPTVTRAPRQVVRGDARHGVVRYACELAAAVGARAGGDVPIAADSGLGGAGPLHLHFTDRVWGADPGTAARRIEGLAAVAPLTVTLHDLPQASDGPRNLARRAACYRRVVRAARGVVVSSAHEAALLRDVVRPGNGVEPVVIPLPVDVHPRPAARPPADDEVAVAGFFYPGKGHAEAVGAVAALADARQPAAAGLGVTALGGASAGHEAELAQAVADAARRGVRFTVTGWLDDAELLDRCRRAAVPLAAHRHVSASGSVVAWVAAGRRPLVPDTRYSREMATLRPGTLTLYASGDLAGAVERARRDPASTWWDDAATTGPGLREVADAHLAWWADAVAWG